MFPNKRPYTFDRVVRMGITIGIIWGIIWVLGYLSDVLIPFAIALLLAYLINPLVLIYQKKIRSRPAAVFMAIISVAIAITLICWLLIPMIMNEISSMRQILSNIVNNSNLTERTTKLIPPHLIEDLQKNINKKEVLDFFKTENFWIIAEKILRKILPGIWGVISGARTILLGLTGIIIIGLYLVFLLLDFQKISDTWKGLIPQAYRKTATAFIDDFNTAMKRHFRAQAAVASIVGGLFAIGFLIIGLPMGILFGLFIGVLNMIPYMQLLALIPAFMLAVLHALETGGSIWLMLGLTNLVFIIVQLIQDSILVPRIMGKVTGLNPAIILLSLSIWGKLLGIFGLLIALPMTCLVLAYYKRFIDEPPAIQTEQPNE